jgi:hypothetical protein
MVTSGMNSRILVRRVFSKTKIRASRVSVATTTLPGVSYPPPRVPPLGPALSVVFGLMRPA